MLTDAESGILRSSWKSCVLRLRTLVATYPVSRFVAISEFVKQRLMSLGIREEQIAVIHNGIDAQQFSSDPVLKAEWTRRWNIPDGDLVLATICALEPRKDVPTLLESVALLTRRGIKVHLFVAGEGSLRAKLERLSDRLGTSGQIHWLGYLASPRELLSGADIFVLSSVGEAFGNVLAEAMACGLPVVASRSGGIGEVIEEGKVGLLAPPGVPSAFTDAVEILAKDPELRRRMGRCAQECARQRFGLTGFTEKTLGVYESIWHGSRSRSPRAPGRVPEK